MPFSTASQRLGGPPPMWESTGTLTTRRLLPNMAPYTSPTSFAVTFGMVGMIWSLGASPAASAFATAFRFSISTAAFVC